jgi:hypothetical protein
MQRRSVAMGPGLRSTAAVLSVTSYYRYNGGCKTLSRRASALAVFDAAS